MMPTQKQASIAQQKPHSQAQDARDGRVEQAIDRLRNGARELSHADIATRRDCAHEVLEQVVKCAPEWVDACCRIKQIPDRSAGVGEEVLAGPGGVARYLRLMIRSLDEIAQTGRPRLSGKVGRLSDGRLRVPMFPARGIYDSLIFAGIKAEARMQSGVEESTLHGDRLHRLDGSDRTPRVGVVLGAGNVSSIPTADSLTRVFQDGNAVLLKLNPVQDTLKDVFEEALQPLIKRGWLQIVTGGAEVGAAAVYHQEVDEVHITGSHHTHDAIVWGRDPDERARRKRENDPILKKPITSEMGNVSPWIIVPGNYSEKELKSQATHVAASLANNAGFNCLTTRMIITWKKWPDRGRFLDMVQAVLNSIPPRVAFYPGAEERYARLTRA
ncbi:MAG: aldehyde dehydrogenase family protein, partial [Planctomycetaceae bacterium]|nr:aldehyde dehydrogenase family protein [Planctomycetaceae bacterium]